MTGFSAADMTTARAKGYRDASEGAAQEAWIVVKEHVWDHDDGDRPTLAYLWPLEFDRKVFPSSEAASEFLKGWPLGFVKMRIGPVPVTPVAATPGIDLRVRELLARRLRQWRTHLPADPAKPGTRAIRTYDHPGLEGETDYNNDVAIWREACSVLDEALTLIDASPVAQIDPLKLGAAMTAFDAAGGHSVRYAPEWMRKALEAASTPAAPGIDLLNTAYFQGWACAANWAGRADLVSDVGSGAYIRERDARLRPLIDASPKGGINSRATFEAWAAGKILPLHRMQIHIGIMGDYSDAWTHCAWTAWQAAMQATSAEVGA